MVGRRKLWKQKAAVFGASLGAATLTHLFLNGEPLRYGIAYGAIWLAYNILEKRIPASLKADLRPYWPHWYNYNQGKVRLFWEAVIQAPLLEEAFFRGALVVANTSALNPLIGSIFGYLHRVEKALPVHRASAIPLAMFGALLGSLALNYGWVYAWAGHMAHNALIALPRLLVRNPSSNIYRLLEKLSLLYTGAHSDYLQGYVRKIQTRDILEPPEVTLLINSLPHSTFVRNNGSPLAFYPSLPVEKEEELAMWNNLHAEMGRIYKQFSS